MPATRHHALRRDAFELEMLEGRLLLAGDGLLVAGAQATGAPQPQEHVVVNQTSSSQEASWQRGGPVQSFGAFALQASEATPNTWQGQTTIGAFNDPANWSLGHAPTAGEIIAASGALTFTDATLTLAHLESQVALQFNGELTLTGTLKAPTVTIAAGGALLSESGRTPTVDGDLEVAGAMGADHSDVNYHVTGDLTVAAGGTLTAEIYGYGQDRYTVDGQTNLLGQVRLDGELAREDIGRVFTVLTSTGGTDTGGGAAQFTDSGASPAVALHGYLNDHSAIAVVGGAGAEVFYWRGGADNTLATGANWDGGVAPDLAALGAEDVAMLNPASGVLLSWSPNGPPVTLDQGYLVLGGQGRLTLSNTAIDGMRIRLEGGTLDVAGASAVTFGSLTGHGTVTGGAMKMEELGAEGGDLILVGDVTLTGSLAAVFGAPAAVRVGANAATGAVGDVTIAAGATIAPRIGMGAAYPEEGDYADVLVAAGSLTNQAGNDFLAARGMMEGLMLVPLILRGEATLGLTVARSTTAHVFINRAGGDFLDAANWRGGAPGAGTGDTEFVMPAFANAAAAVLDAPGGTVTVGDFYLGGKLRVEAGTLALAGAPGNGTSLELGGELTFTGTGAVLSAAYGNFVEVRVGGSLTLGSGAALSMTGGYLDIAGQATVENGASVALSEGSGWSRQIVVESTGELTVGTAATVTLTGQAELDVANGGRLTLAGGAVSSAKDLDLYGELHGHGTLTAPKVRAYSLVAPAGGGNLQIDGLLAFVQTDWTGTTPTLRLAYAGGWTRLEVSGLLAQTEIKPADQDHPEDYPTGNPAGVIAIVAADGEPVMAGGALVTAGAFDGSFAATVLPAGAWQLVTDTTAKTITVVVPTAVYSAPLSDGLGAVAAQLGGWLALFDFSKVNFGAQGLVAPQLPVAPNELATLFGLPGSVTFAPGSYSTANGLGLLTDALATGGYTVTGVQGGYDGIPAATGGDLLTATRTFTLLHDFAVNNWTGSPANAGATNLLRGLATDANLEGTINWLAGLTFALSFGLDSTGAFFLSGGSGLTLTMAGTGGTFTGTATVAGQPGQAVSGTFGANYTVSLGFADAATRYRDMVAIGAGTLAPSATGTAGVTLTATAGYTTLNYAANYSAAAGATPRGTEITDTHTLSGAFIMPGLTDAAGQAASLPLTGTYDAVNARWELTGAGTNLKLAGGPINSVSLVLTVSPAEIVGTLAGQVELVPLRTAADAAVTQDFTGTVQAAAFNATATTTGQTIELREKGNARTARLEGAAVTTTFTADATAANISTTFTATGATLWPDATNATLTVTDGADADALAVTGTADLLHDAATVTLDTLTIESAHRLQIAALGASLTIRRQEEQTYSTTLAATARILSLQIPMAEGLPAAPPSLPVQLTLTDAGFSLADASGSFEQLAAGGAVLGTTALSLTGASYLRTDGVWSGSATARAEAATMWAGRAVFTSATAVKLTVTTDLATMNQTFAADGADFGFGDQLTLMLPALSFTYNARDGPAAGFGLVDGVRVASPLLPGGIQARVDGVGFDWNQVTVPAFSAAQEGSFDFDGGRIQVSGATLASDGITIDQQAGTGTGALRLTAGATALTGLGAAEGFVNGAGFAATVAASDGTAGAVGRLSLAAGGRTVAFEQALAASGPTVWRAADTVAAGDAATAGLAGEIDWQWVEAGFGGTFTGALTVQNQTNAVTDAALTLRAAAVEFAAADVAVAWRGVMLAGGATVTLADGAVGLAAAAATGSLGLFATARELAAASFTYGSDGAGTAVFTVAVARSDANYSWTPSVQVAVAGDSSTFTFAASALRVPGPVDGVPTADAATLLALPQFTVTRSAADDGDALATVNGVAWTDPFFGAQQTLDGVTLARDGFALPEVRQTLGDHRVDGTPFTLVAPTYAHSGARVDLFPPVEPSAGNAYRGTFTLTAATATATTAGLSATEAVLTVTVGAMPPNPAGLTLGGLVYARPGVGTVTLADVSLQPHAAVLYQTATAQLAQTDGGTINLENFILQGDGTVVLDTGSATGTLEATVVWIAGFLKLDVTGQAQARYAGDTNLNGVLDPGEVWDRSQVVFRVEGTLDFAALAGFAFAPQVGMGGGTYSAGAANLVLAVAVVDGVATPWDAGTVTFGFANWQIGDAAKLSLTAVLGSYTSGGFTAGGAGGSATLTLGGAFNNPGPFTGENVTATVDRDTRTVALAANFPVVVLKTAWYQTPAVTVAFGQTFTYAATEARTLTVNAPALGATLAGSFSYQPAGIITFTFENAVFDLTAKGAAQMFSAATGTVRVDVATLNIAGTVKNFGLGADGHARVGDQFSVELGGDEAFLDAMKWPVFLPVRVDTLGLYWADFNHAPEAFRLILGVTVKNLPVPGSALKFSGAIKGLVIDTALLEAGKFPVVGMDAVELLVSGQIGSAEVTGGFLLGLVRIDAQGNVIGTLDQTTPVARSVLYGAIRGGIKISGCSFELYLGLSEYGPLAGYVRAGAPVVIGGPTGFAVSDFRAGLFFNSATPEITDARQLITNTIPEITPVSMQTFDLWRQGFYNQLTAQILAMNAPNPFYAMLSSPFRLEGGAQFYNVYATDKAFSVQADLILDSQGKLTLVGRLDLFKDPTDSSKPIAQYILRAHLDISQLAAGDGAILVHLEYVKSIGISIKGKDLKPLNFSVWGSLRFDFGTTIDPDNPPPSLFETFTVEIVGGFGLTGFDMTIADMQGTVRLSASLHETQARVEFFGEPHFAGISDALGAMPLFQGAFDFSYDADGNVQLAGAFFGGGDLELLRQAGVTVVGDAVIRLNTTGSDVNFTLDLGGGAPRQILLPAATMDLFVEGMLAYDYGGTRYFEMLGALGVKVDADGVALFGTGSLTGSLPGNVTLFHADASLLARVTMNGTVPELVLAARFNAPQSPVLAAAGVTLNGRFELLLNTSGRAVTFEVPTEFPDLLGVNTITVTAGLPQLDGTEGPTAPWLLLRSDFALDPTRSLQFGDAFVASGDILLAVSTATGATLAFNGRLDVVVNSQTLLQFNATGSFVLEAGGLYGFATATLLGTGALPGGAPVTLTGSFRFEVNTTGVAHTLGPVTLGAGSYLRLRVDGALEFGRLMVNGTLDLSAAAGQGLRLAVTGTTALGIPGADFLRFDASGEVGVNPSGVYGELTLVRRADYELDGLNVGFSGDFTLAFNTTDQAWHGLPANGGVRFQQDGAITIGNLALVGNHSFTLSPDKLVLNLSGGVAFGQGGATLFTVPVSLTVDLDLPAIVIDRQLAVSARDAGLDAFGFGADAILRLQVNSSGAAQGSLPAGPYVRLELDGALNVGGLSLTGRHTVSADLRSVWVESDATLELRVANEKVLAFTAQGRGFFGFAGLAGRYAVGLSPGSIGDLDLGNLAALAFTFEFNTNGMAFTLPNGEVMAAGPFARLEANGALTLQGLTIDGRLGFFAEAGQVRWSVTGGMALQVPGGPVLLTAQVDGAGWLRREGLTGLFTATASTLPVTALGFDFNAGAEVRFEVNLTGVAQDLGGGLTLEAGRYARLTVAGGLEVGALTLNGRHSFKFEGNTLTLTTDGETQFSVPPAVTGGERLVLLRVGGHGGLAIDAAGIAGTFTAGLLDAASGVQQKFAGLGVNFDPSAFTYQLEINTTGAERTVGGVTVAAGRYARLAFGGAIDLGGFRFTGDFHLSAGATGLDLGVDAIFDLKAPTVGALPEVLLFRYRASGGLLITAKGVAGVLSDQVLVDRGDTSSLGFSLPSANYSYRWEANFTGEAVTVAGQTLAAGRYFRAVLTGGISLGTADFAGLSGRVEFYVGDNQLEWVVDGLAYIGVPQPGGPTLKVVQADVKGRFFVTAAGLYGEAGVYRAVTPDVLNGLVLGLDASDLVQQARDGLRFWVNTTGAERTIAATGHVLPADELVGLSYHGYLRMDLPGGVPGLRLDGDFTLVLQREGVRVQADATADLFGLKANFLGGLLLAYDGFATVFELNLPQIDLGGLHVITLGGHFEFQMNTRGTAQTFAFGEDGTARTVTVQPGAFLLLVRDANVNLLGGFVITGNVYFERTPDGVWRGDIPDDAPLHVELIPGVTADVRGWLAEDGTHEFTGSVVAAINYAPIVSLIGRLDFVFRQLTASDPAFIDIDLDATLNFLGTTAPVTGTIDRDGQNWDAHFRTKGTSQPYALFAGLTFDGQFDLHFEGAAFGYAVLTGSLNFGGLDATGTYRVDVADGTTTISLDGRLDFAIPAVGGAPALALGELRIDGLIRGDAAGWRGVAGVTLIDQAQFNAGLRTLGIDVADPQFDLHFVINTTGATQAVALPGGGTQTLAAGVYHRLAFDARAEVLGTYVDAHWYFERDGANTYAGVEGTWELALPALGALPRLTFAAFKVDGRFVVLGSGIAGRLLVSNEFMSFLPSIVTLAIPSQTQSTYFAFNTTGQAVALGDEVLSAAAFAELRYQGRMSMGTFAFAWFDGAAVFRAGSDGLHVLLDADFIFGLPKENIVSSYYRFGASGELFVGRDGAYGELGIHEGVGVGAVASAFSFDLSSERRIFLNTTQADQTLTNGRVLRGDEVVGFEIGATIGFNFLGLTGHLRASMIEGGMRMQVVGTANVLGQTFDFDNLMEVTGAGVVGGARLTLPNFDLGGAGLVTLGGDFVLSYNTTDTARRVEALDKTVAADTVYLEARNLNLRGLYRVAGSFGFGYTGGQWVANIPEAAPLTLSLLPGWETTLYGTIRQDGYYSLTGTSTFTAGDNAFAGFSATATVSLSSAEALSGTFAGTTWLLGASNAVSGSFRAVNGDYEFNVADLAATVGGFGLTGGAGTLLVRADGSVRVALTTPLTVALPVLGTASFGGYVDSRDGLDLTATQQISIAIGAAAPFRFAISGTSALRITLEGSAWSFAMTNALSVEAFGHQEVKNYSATFGGEGLDFYLPGEFNLGELSVSGAALLRVRADGVSFVIDDGAPLTASLAQLGRFELRGYANSPSDYSFSGQGSFDAGVSGLAGLAASATFSLSSSGQVSGSFAGTTWLLGASNAVSGSFRAVNGDYEFNVADLAATVGGFGLTGGAGTLLVRADGSVRVALTTPLTVALPVLGTASFGGYVDSRDGLDLTATQQISIAIGAAAPFRFAISGTSALRITLEGSAWSFAMTNALSVEAFGHQEVKNYSATFGGEGLDFYLPGNFTLGGLSVSGAALLRARPDGVSFQIYDDNPLVANIPLLGRFELRGYANSPDDFSFTGTANINSGDPAGFVRISGGTTLTVANTGASFSLANGRVDFMGASAGVSTAGTYRPADNYLSFTVGSISFNAAGLGTLGGGFTYVLQNGASTMTVDSGNPLRFSLFGATATLSGVFRSNGTSNLSGSAWLDSGIGDLLRARGTLSIGYVNGRATASLAGEAVLNGAVIARLTADVATDFSSYFQLSLPAAGLSLGGFAVSGSLAYRADNSGARHTLIIGSAAPVAVAIASLGSAGFSGSITAQNGGIAYDLTGRLLVSFGDTNVGARIDATLRLSNAGITASGRVTAYLLGSTAAADLTLGVHPDRVEFGLAMSFGISGVVSASVDVGFVAYSGAHWQFNIRSGSASVAGFASIGVSGYVGSGGTSLAGSGTAWVGDRRVASFEGSISWTYDGSGLRVSASGSAYLLGTRIGGVNGGVGADGGGFNLWFSATLWPVSGLTVGGGFSLRVEGGGVYASFSGSASLFGTLNGSVSGSFDTRWGRRNWQLSGSAGFYIGNGNVGASGGVSFSVGPGYINASAWGSAWIGFSLSFWVPKPTWSNWLAGYWSSKWIGGSINFNTGFDWNGRALYFKIVGKDVRIQIGGSLGVYFSEVGGSTVFLDANRNGSLDPGEPWTVADANGVADFSASFDPEPAGLGALARFDANDNGVLDADEGQFVVNGGTGLGESSAPADQFTLAAGSPNGGTLFAGATIFFDANRNGVRDEGEPETTTDARGFYVFSAPPSVGLGALAAYDRNGNGAIDPEEGVLYVEGGTRRPAAGEPTVVRYFVDANGNGRLDEGERLVDATADAGYDLAQLIRQAAQTLTMFDTDHDGTVSDGELSAARNDGGILYLDLNGNGVRDADEPQAALPPIRDHLGVFAALDANGNGALDFEELDALQSVILPGTPLTSPQAIPMAASGYVPVDHATRVFLDLNGNGRYDEGEPATSPDALGFYTFITPTAGEVAARLGRLAPFDRNGNGKIDPDEGVLVVLGGTDNNNGLANPIVALGLADQYGNGAGTALGTLSTLVVALTDLGLTPDEARARVDLAFGLQGGSDTIDPTDLYSTGGGQDAELLQLAAQLNTIILGGAAALGDAAAPASQRAVIDALARWILANVGTTPANVPTVRSSEAQPAAGADLTSGALIGAVLNDAGGADAGAVGAATQVLSATNTAIQGAVAAGGDVTAELARIKAVTIGTTAPRLADVASGQAEAGTVVDQLTGDGLANAIGAVQLRPGAPPVLTGAVVPLARTGQTVIVPLTVTDGDTPLRALRFAADLPPVADRVQAVEFAFNQGRWLATVTLRPDAPTGAFTLAVTVSDGGAPVPGAVEFASVLTAPVIAPVAPLIVNAGEAAAPVAIQLGNVTDLAALTLASDNPLVLPISSLLLTGTGDARTLTLQPPAGAQGVVQVTLTLTDSGAVATRTLKVTVTNGNQPPVLQGVSAGPVARGETVLVPLTVADPDTGPGDLAFSATASPAVQSATFVLVDGRWFARLSVREDAALGAAAVMLTANDGEFSSEPAALSLEVVPSPLGIAPLEPLSTRAGQPSPPFTFTLTSVSPNAVLSATSGNGQMLANAGIEVSGTGDSRQIVLTPSAGVTGTVALILTLTDGSLKLTKAVDVEVLPVLVANRAGADVVLDPNAAPFPLDLAALFNRSGNVSYAITVTSGRDLVTVTRDGAQALLTLTPDHAGLAEVRVGATDGLDAATFTLAVRVPPAIGGEVLAADEALGVARFAVTATPSNTAFALAYRTVDGTAVAGRDYEAQSGVLQFAPGESRKIVEVPLLPNHRPGDQVVSLQLGGDGGGARLISATIADADLALLQTLYSMSRPAPRLSFSGFQPAAVTDALDAAGQGEEAGAPAATVRVQGTAAEEPLTAAPLAASPVPAGDLAAATGLDALATVRTIPGI